MKQKYILITIVIILIGVLVFEYMNNTNSTLATYQSPDGNYQLIVIMDRNNFTVTMPGNGGVGSLPVKVVLKDAKGKIIGSSNTNTNCGAFKGSIEIDWDLKNNEVWYARGKSINLKTGKVEC